MALKNPVRIIKNIFKSSSILDDNFDTASFLERNKTELSKLDNVTNPLSLKIKQAIIASNSKIPVDAKKSINLIEQERHSLYSNNALLVDGSLGEAGLYDKDVTLQQVCNVSKPFKQALCLFHLVREIKPEKMLELGTNIGISSAYLALAAKLNHKGKIITMEASPYRIKVAKSIHAKVDLKNIDYINGLFTDTLDKTLRDFSPIDFAFIDGHHQYQPTLDYFNLIHTSSTENAVFIFDDIRWSDGMLKAWDEIKVDNRVVIAIDLDKVGVIVCSKSIQQSNAIIVEIK